MKTTELRIKYVPRDESWLDGGEVAVPLELTVRDGAAIVEYYPSVKGDVDELLRLYGKDEETLLSREAIMWAAEKFDAFLEAHGFSLSPDSHDYYINYKLSSPRGDIPPEIRRLTGTAGYNDLTDTDIDGLISEGYIVYAAIVDGNIAALANTGVPVGADAPSEIEIGVDTAEEYRRRGLGGACVRALVWELERTGRSAVYECASGNTASIRLAESLGGVVMSRKFYIVGFTD